MLRLPVVIYFSSVLIVFIIAGLSNRTIFRIAWSDHRPLVKVCGPLFSGDLLVAQAIPFNLIFNQIQ